MVTAIFKHVKFLSPKALAHYCLLCQSWIKDDPKSYDGASLPDVLSEVLSSGPRMLKSLGVDQCPNVSHST